MWVNRSLNLLHSVTFERELSVHSAIFHCAEVHVKWAFAQAIRVFLFFSPTKGLLTGRRQWSLNCYGRRCTGRINSGNPSKWTVAMFTRFWSAVRRTLLLNVHTIFWIITCKVIWGCQRCDLRINPFEVFRRENNLVMVVLPTLNMHPSAS